MAYDPTTNINVSASAACLLLDGWLSGKLALTRERVLAHVEAIDELLCRTEARAAKLGWTEESMEREAGTHDSLDDVSDDDHYGR